MRVIIIEDSVYKVSEKEYLKLRKMADESTYSDYPLNERLSDELNNYLDDNKSKYKLIGAVNFDWRR